MRTAVSPLRFLLPDASSHLSRGRAVRPATRFMSPNRPLGGSPSRDPAVSLCEGSCDGPLSPARSAHQHRPTQARWCLPDSHRASSHRGNQGLGQLHRPASPPPAPIQHPSSSHSQAVVWLAVGVRSYRFAPSDPFGPDRPQTRVVLMRGGSRPASHSDPIGTDGQPADWSAGRSTDLAPNRPPTLEPAPPSTTNPHVTPPGTGAGTAPDS